MAWDLQLTRASLRLGRKTASSSLPIEQEGVLLVKVLEDGEEKVALKATPAGTDKVVGFAQLGDALPDVTSWFETVTVPASGALEVDLRRSKLVTAKIRAVVVSTGEVLTVDETFAGATADGAVKVDIDKGRAKFHADEAGKDVAFTYLYQLTRREAKQTFGERHINNTGLHADFGQLEVGAGEVELHTDQFDPSKDYSAGATLKLGANGIITIGGAGPDLNGEVIKLPGEDNQGFLGVKLRLWP